MPVTRNQLNAVNAVKPSSGSPEDSGSKESSERDETTSEAEPHRRESPDNCSICLGPFNNKSFTSSCAHSFCFVCLKQWSKVKAECPLCKQPFTSIFHNIRSDQSYDIYELPPVNPPHPSDYSFYNYFPRSLFTTPTHHYISLTRPGLDADLTLSNFSRFQFRHRRYDRYLQPQHPVHGEHQYSYTSSSFNAANHVSAVSWARGPEDFRREVYRHNLGPPFLILGTENSTYRLTPAMVAASSHRLQRIMPWLTRELKVLLKSHQNVRLAISIIQPLLTQVTIDSTHFSEKVSPLLGRKSRHFIQEFVAFTNSALTMQAFDRKAMYHRRDTTAAFTENTSSSSSGDDDDVVEITDVSSDTEITGRTSPVAGSSGFLRTGWDSPTPGPSWGSLEMSNVRSLQDIVSVSSESDDPVFRPDLNDSDSSSKAGSDIVFLKYDKPWTERSPIQLSSDSEHGGRNKRKRKSKHKKKKRDHIDTISKVVEKELKSPTRSKSGDKSIQQKTSSVDDPQPETSRVSGKKRGLSVSSEKQRKKKKKKSRERERELVDRLFAEAMSQQIGTTTLPENFDLTDGPSSSKAKDVLQEKSGRSEKGKHKHKKKDKNHSRDSQSPSILHAYKKHHSGHKKSSEAIGRIASSEGERRKHKSKYNLRGDAASDLSGEGESSAWESQPSRSQPIPPQSISHSMTSSFQPNYIAMPDTLQHIPLNLWVSTWPAMPSTHPFPAPPPPPATFLPTSRPLSTGLAPSAVDSHTVLSESSSNTDSDDTEDYDNTNPVPTNTRTKQWLEANFPEQGKSPSSSKTHTGGSNMLSWDVDTASYARKSQEPTLAMTRNSDHLDNIVSIPSDDEDVVVCSSVSSTKSDSDEVKVIEVGDLHVSHNCVFDMDPLGSSGSLCFPSSNSQGREGQSTSSFDQSLFSEVKSHDPLLSFTSQLPPLQSEITFNEEKDVLTDTNPVSNDIVQPPLPRSDQVAQEVNPQNKRSIFPDLPRINSTHPTDVSNVYLNANTSSLSQETTPTVTLSNPPDSIFSVKTSLQLPAAPIGPLLSSNLTYLPCPSTSLSSILSHPLPYGISQPQQQDGLPMHLTLHTVPSLLSPSPAIFPRVFQPYSQSLTGLSPTPSTSTTCVNGRTPYFSCASLMDVSKGKPLHSFGVDGLLNNVHDVGNKSPSLMENSATSGSDNHQMDQTAVQCENTNVEPQTSESENFENTVSGNVVTGLVEESPQATNVFEPYCSLEDLPSNTS
ncbi:unnamed protein product [Lymnaea stagnalis]|uniref:E3 ubiquitin-protein ligase Topors n=1 Tax=Lymnaea stagnalis TaxID=6523 RepID=A0AAV2H738_LYMST